MGKYSKKDVAGTFIGGRIARVPDEDGEGGYYAIRVPDENEDIHTEIFHFAKDGTLIDDLKRDKRDRFLSFPGVGLFKSQDFHEHFSHVITIFKKDKSKPPLNVYESDGILSLNGNREGVMRGKNEMDEINNIDDKDIPEEWKGLKKFKALERQEHSSLNKPVISGPMTAGAPVTPFPSGKEVAKAPGDKNRTLS